MRGRDVGILREIIDVVEAVAGDQFARRERPAPLVAAGLEEMRQRVEPASPPGAASTVNHRGSTMRNSNETG
jgi:hypothetical protein